MRTISVRDTQRQDEVTCNRHAPTRGTRLGTCFFWGALVASRVHLVVASSDERRPAAFLLTREIIKKNALRGARGVETCQNRPFTGICSHPTLISACKDENCENDHARTGSDFHQNSAASDHDMLFLERFRRQKQRSNAREWTYKQLLPPNPGLEDPSDVCSTILNQLRYHSSDPKKHDSGPRVLLRSCTDSWRKTIHRWVQANDDANETTVAIKLQQQLSHSDNQFGILFQHSYTVQWLDYNDGDVTVPTENEKYLIQFPSDPVDFGDGECWLECRLRNPDTNELQVVMGWTFRKRDQDGAWLVDNPEWQDFRADFRPGIGREEWERICG